MKSIVLVFGLLLGLSTNGHAETLTWTLQNSSGEFALLQFYSKSRNALWPTYNRGYNLPADDQSHTFSLRVGPETSRWIAEFSEHEAD
jgi:hypothetical protein